MDRAGLRHRIARLSLSQRFAVTGGIVMIVAMMVIGYWVSAKIEQDVIDSTAASTALYMDSFIAPLVQELDTADTLSIGPIRAIEEMLSGSALGRRIVAVKIWKPDGLVAYSDEPAVVGRRFLPSESLKKALEGHVVAEFDDLEDAENREERAISLPLLEIYSPLRLSFSGRIVGVLEFYENASALKEALGNARRQSWMIVAAVTLAIGALLFGIVHRGSVLIERQRAALQARIAEAQSMSEQNRELRLRVERASQRVAELNERTLRRVSAELHDGPKQLIGLAALRLDAVGRADTNERRDRDLAVVREALGEAMREIGNLCSDLSVPEVDRMSLADVVRRVAAAHSARTATEVTLDLAPSVPPVSQALRICAYRFTQETLNNAYRHAGGADQIVRLRQDGLAILLVVSNGAGTPVAFPCGATSGGLGLAGLRERVESLGGRFEFTRDDTGAIAMMTIPAEHGDHDG